MFFLGLTCIYVYIFICNCLEHAFFFTRCFGLPVGQVGQLHFSVYPREVSIPLVVEKYDYYKVLLVKLFLQMQVDTQVFG